MWATPQPLVSIIINNYNYQQFLRQAIESSLSQTYCNLEVIVVDDGSTDHSWRVIQDYAGATEEGRQPRLLPILKPNGGQASAMNAGFAASRGEIILFLDADDYLLPDAVETIVAHWQPDGVQMQSRLNMVDTEGNFIDLYPAPEITFDTGDVCPLLLKKGRYNTTVTSGNSFSRQVLEQIFPIPEADFRISADGYLVTVAPFYGKVQAIEQPIGCRRKHGENLWASAGRDLVVERFRKSFRHDFLRYQALTQVATQRGDSVGTDLGLNDPLHVSDRLVSLRLDPQNHPVETDRAGVLGMRGFWAIWKYSGYRPKRKILLSLWFLWVGLMPMGLAKPAIAWLLANQSRPAIIDRLLKTIRAATA